MRASLVCIMYAVSLPPPPSPPSPPLPSLIDLLMKPSVPPRTSPPTSLSSFKLFTYL